MLNGECVTDTCNVSAPLCNATLASLSYAFHLTDSPSFNFQDDFQCPGNSQRKSGLACYVSTHSMVLHSYPFKTNCWHYYRATLMIVNVNLSSSFKLWIMVKSTALQIRVKITSPVHLIPPELSGSNAT